MEAHEFEIILTRDEKTILDWLAQRIDQTEESGDVAMFYLFQMAYNCLSGVWCKLVLEQDEAVRHFAIDPHWCATVDWFGEDFAGQITLHAGGRLYVDLKTEQTAMCRVCDQVFNRFLHLVKRMNAAMVLNAANDNPDVDLGVKLELFYPIRFMIADGALGDAISILTLIDRTLAAAECHYSESSEWGRRQKLEIGGNVILACAAAYRLLEPDFVKTP